MGGQFWKIEVFLWGREEETDIWEAEEELGVEENVVADVVKCLNCFVQQEEKLRPASGVSWGDTEVYIGLFVPNLIMAPIMYYLPLLQVRVWGISFKKIEK